MLLYLAKQFLVILQICSKHLIIQAFNACWVIAVSVYNGLKVTGLGVSTYGIIKILQLDKTKKHFPFHDDKLHENKDEKLHLLIIYKYIKTERL